LHFISSDHTRGGHILNFILTGGKCEIDVLHQYFVKLPEGNAAFAGTDLSKDRTQELKKVEGVSERE
jgi:acetolactate decarboxylase